MESILLLFILVVEFAQLNYIINLKRELLATVGLLRSHLEGLQRRVSDDAKVNEAKVKEQDEYIRTLITDVTDLNEEIESLKKLTLTSAADIEDLKSAKEKKHAKRKSRK